MPSYGGLAIFGRSPTIIHAVNPSAQQLNEFFGTSGQQSLWGGWRGRSFLASGVLAGPSAYDLDAAEAVFRSFAGDGIARVLVDSFGDAWPYVLCESYSPDGRVKIDPYYGYFRPYRAAFRGLI